MGTMTAPVLGSTADSPDPSVGAGGDELSQAMGEAFDSSLEGAESGQEAAETGEPQQTGEVQEGIEQALSEGTPESGKEPYPLSPDGTSYMVPKEEIAQFQAAQQDLGAYRQLFSSPQEAQQATGEASNFRRIMNDWTLGTPDLVRGVLEYLAGGGAQTPEYRARQVQAFSQAALQMPEILGRVNPQATQQLAGRFLAQRAQELYQKAAQTGDPDDLLAAQGVDWAHRGEYLKEPPKVDPQQSQLQALEQREQAFNQRQNALLQQEVRAFAQQHLNPAQELNAKLDQILPKMIQQAKVSYPGKSYDYLKQGILQDLAQKLRSSHGDWMEEQNQNYQGIIQDFQTTWHRGNAGAGLLPRVQAYVANYVNRAMRELPSIAQNALKSDQKTQQVKTSKPVNAQRPPQNGRQSVPSQNGQNGSMKRLSSSEWESEWAKQFQVR